MHYLGLLAERKARQAEAGNNIQQGQGI
jgi:hypothetical protein